jgi:hypothetical protein
MLPAIIAGVVIGLAYTLSPLTVLFFAALPLLWRYAKRGLSADERRHLLIVLSLAVFLRLIVLALLFLTADPSVPYANLFGDEEFFKRRSLWLTNLGLGIPVHGADIIYAFDETGRSSYLYVLAYLQAIVGAAPYGVHLFNALLYLAGVIILYRLVRNVYGEVAALAGAGLLLFLPSLFMWSISALKEPLYISLCAAELACAVQIARAPRWWQRVLALIGVVVIGQALQTLRFGGLALALVGTVVGLAAGLLLTRPRWLLAAAVVGALVLPPVLARPAVQQRIMSGVAMAAFQHWGHVATPGYTYKLLEPRYYADRLSVRAMTPPEAGRYIVRAFVAYITVPLPWQIESRSMLVFLPEQIVWYFIVLLIPFGLVAGLRRDAVVTSLIAAHGFVAVAMVALTGGNIGTLVRHRGLALPYLAFLAALGACVLLARAVERKPATQAAAPPSVVTPAWR